MPPARPLIKSLIGELAVRVRQLPVAYVVLFLVALVIQLNPTWREALIYERNAVGAGEWWRLWTGHLVHFGWPHCLADSGLLFLIGWTFGQKHPCASHLGLVLMPLFISATLYWLDPMMVRYGGLSAVDLGLLLLLAVQNWQRQWSDWFWPAILLIYVGEIVLEIASGGQGGGMIKFDDPTVQVATSAHLAAAAYAVVAWGIGRMFVRWNRPR
jgi:rhomboid family GlyGly-CTERM serine protease